MLARSALVVATLVLVGCTGSADNPIAGTANSIEPAAASAPDSPAGDTGTAVFTVRVDDAATAGNAADALSIALEAVDPQPPTIDGTEITLEVPNIARADAEAIELDLGETVTLSLRPVIPIDQAASAGNDILTDTDGAPLTVGPAQADETAFGEAFAIEDDFGGWSITVEIADEAAWNALATQCFEGAPTCPPDGISEMGRLAIVVNNEILSAPTVNTPVFVDDLAISGQFSEAETRELATAINRANSPFTVSSTEFAFVPDE